jgi:hypothetical protein
VRYKKKIQSPRDVHHGGQEGINGQHKGGKRERIRDTERERGREGIKK